MNFENAAFLFDSTLLDNSLNSTIHGVISFVSNPIYISAYAKEAADKFDMSTSTSTGLKDWLKIGNNEDAYAPFLIKLYDDIGKFGLLSFFIDKDYSSFIHQISLMFGVSEANYDFKKNLDLIYEAYKSEYNDRIILGSVEETVTEFNERIQQLFKKHKSNHSFINLLNEKIRSLDEQITMARAITDDGKHDYSLADRFFYSKQIISAYKDKGVHDVYATKHAGQQLKEVVSNDTQSIKVNTSSTGDYTEEFEVVTKFVRILMMSTQYFFEKIVDVKNLDSIAEEDKYLFVIIWMILQSGNNDIFINNRSYELIKELFLSIKKDLSV